MDAQELLGKVRKIEIRARGLSRNVFAGEYHSAFRGRGMAFSEVREYQYGDDVRDIDWNVTARLHRPYVKLFEEERELTVMLLVDVSGSLDFGTTQQTKRDMATEMAATLAFSAIQNNDKIGVVFFSDRIEKYIPPQKGRRHILYIIREMLQLRPQSRRTNIGQAIEFLNRVTKRRTTASSSATSMTPTTTSTRSTSPTASTTSWPYSSTTPCCASCPTWDCSASATPRRATRWSSTRATSGSDAATTTTGCSRSNGCAPC